MSDEPYTTKWIICDEGPPMSKQSDVLRSIAVACDPLAAIADYIDRLEATNAELLKVCSELIECGEESWRHDRPCLEVARAAITKAMEATDVV